jgi:hypothetical protein
VESEEQVVVTVVASGPEADIVCGLLRSAGIECGYRDTEAIDLSLEEFTAAGPREILVHPVRPRGRARAHRFGLAVRHLDRAERQLALRSSDQAGLTYLLIDLRPRR